jgi:hypothetical protein
MLPEDYFTYSCSTENLQGLKAQVYEAFCQVAQAYYLQTGEKLHVTSARRSLHHCAQLMAAMSPEQLQGMYCSRGTPDYIQSIFDAQKEQDEPLSTEQVYKILQNRKAGYISWHLVGAAIDISSKVTDLDLLKKLLQENNFRYLDERVYGIACLHATYKGIKAEVVRD